MGMIGVPERIKITYLEWVGVLAIGAALGAALGAVCWKVMAVLEMLR